MTPLPTLIVLADPTPQRVAERDAVMALEHTIHVGLASGLPMVLVAPSAVAEYARTFLPSNDVVEMTDNHIDPRSAPHALAKAVAAGVMASPHAPGWLLWPADMGDLRSETLRTIAQGVCHYPMVFPQYRQRRGYPVGLSSEFFSELIRLNSERDLGRLMTRYPARGIDVDDPAVLDSSHTQAKLAQLRADLQGAPRGAPANMAPALM